MRPAVDVAGWLAAPLGSFVVGRCWLAWCTSPRQVGFAIWGRPDVDDIRQAIALHDIVNCPRLDRPIDAFIDAQRLEHIDPLVAETYLAAVIPRVDEFRRKIRRQAQLPPGGLLGMIIAGFYPLMRNGPDVRLFNTTAAALEWLGACEESDEIAALVERHAVLPDPLPRVRRWLATEAAAAGSMEHLARLLGLTTRTLQRRLRDLGTSFRSELDLHRIVQARRLLTESEAKVSAVAAAVGFRSFASFAAWFRRRTGKAPSEYRSLSQPK